MLWSIQKALPFSFEDSSICCLLTQNEARLDVKLCSELEGAAPAAQLCSGVSSGFPRGSASLLKLQSEKMPQSCIHRASLIPAALWLLQGVWRLGHELKIMFFDSLRLYINCLEDSCCSLFQQDLSRPSARGRDFCYLQFWQWCAARPVTQTCLFRTLTAPCAWNTTWDITTSCHLYFLLPSHNSRQGAG